MITLKQYADLHHITYEAVRKQVKRYEKDLEGHLIVEGRYTYLDDYAVEFMNNHRLPKTIVLDTLNESARKQVESLCRELEESNKNLAELQTKYVKALEDKERLHESEIKLVQSEAKIELLEERYQQREHELAEAKQKLEEAKQEADSYEKFLWFYIKKKN